MTAPSKTHIDTILREKYLVHMLADTLTSSPGYQQLTAGDSSAAPASAATAARDKAMADFYARRAQLEAMPAAEVARLAAESTARQQAQHQAKLKADAAAKEAARFYNQPEAMADFAYWCKVEFWTLDEAVMLLLERDPQVVTPEALAAELSRPTGFLGFGAAPAKAAFHIAHERLRTLMLRAEALASPRLKPAEVAAWAVQSGAVDVPQALGELLQRRADANQHIAVPAAADASPVRQWTEERLAALKAFRVDHGTSAAAKQFGITASRVRQLLPAAKPTAAPAAGPWDALARRSK